MLFNNKNPFTELLKEAEVVYIEGDKVAIPSNRGKSIEIVTPSMRMKKTFEVVGKKEEFETDYFREKTKSALDISQKRDAITTAEDFFFYNLVRDYLENKAPLTPTKANEGLTTFLQGSTLTDNSITVLTKQKVIRFGGIPTNHTNSYLFDQGTIIPAISESPLNDFGSQYNLRIDPSEWRRGVGMKYTPLFEKKHKKAYIGQNAINRKIKIKKKGDKYSILTYCPKSNVTYKGISYQFDETTLKTSVQIRNGHLQLNTYPTAPKGYEHLFVHSNGTVCYDSEKRFRQIGLTTSTPPLTIETDISDPQTANRLKKVLDEGHQNLHFGDTFATSTATSVDLLKHRQINQYGGLFGTQ